MNAALVPITTSGEQRWLQEETMSTILALTRVHNGGWSVGAVGVYSVTSIYRVELDTQHLHLLALTYTL